jgi:hypothetical protein
VVGIGQAMTRQTQSLCRGGTDAKSKSQKRQTRSLCRGDVTVEYRRESMSDFFFFKSFKPTLNNHMIIMLTFKFRLPNRSSRLSLSSPRHRLRVCHFWDFDLASVPPRHRLCVCRVIAWPIPTTKPRLHLE